MVRVTGLCWVAGAGQVVMVGDDCAGDVQGSSDVVAVVGGGGSDSDVKSVVMVMVMMVLVMVEGQLAMVTVRLLPPC